MNQFEEKSKKSYDSKAENMRIHLTGNSQLSLKES